jgi:GT2 family glycosyltransferase
MKVSVVIPTYSRRDLLEKNLHFVVEAAENRINNIAEIIIVDDGSTDDSYAFVKNNYPQVKIVKHKINRGFSAAVNTGVRSAKSELICLINNDVVPSPDFLRTVLPHFEDNNVFAVSFNEKGEFGWAKGKFIDGFVEHEAGKKSDKPHITFWVSGGSGVFRRSTWIALGGMDEKLFSPFYWEDMDLCYRAVKRGFTLLWESGSLVEHRHESTIGQLSQTYVQRIRERNQLFFLWKNITSRNLFKKHLWGLFKRVVKHPGYLRIVIMALLSLGAVLKARNKETKEAKISDETIFARFQ